MRTPAEIERVLTGAASYRRVIVFRRPDGLFGFGEQYFAESDYAPSKWVSLAPDTTVCDTVETAEREARAAFPWVVAASDNNAN